MDIVLYTDKRLRMYEELMEINITDNIKKEKKHQFISIKILQRSAVI